MNRHNFYLALNTRPQMLISSTILNLIRNNQNQSTDVFYSWSTDIIAKNINLKLGYNAYFPCTY